MADVDCELCRHLDDMDYCGECEHYIDDPVDNYSPYSNEEIKAMEDARLKRFIEGLSTEKLSIDISPDLISIFRKVVRYTDKEGYKNYRLTLIPVYFDTDKMIACDTHRLVEYKCQIPPELQQKHILDISDQGEVTILNQILDSPLTNDNYVQIIPAERVSKMSKSDLLSRIKDYGTKDEGLVIYLFSDDQPVIKRQYSDQALDFFNEFLEVSVNGDLRPILMQDDVVRLIVLPTRIYPDKRKEYGFTPVNERSV